MCNVMFLMFNYNFGLKLINIITYNWKYFVMEEEEKTIKESTLSGYLRAPTTFTIKDLITILIFIIPMATGYGFFSARVSTLEKEASILRIETKDAVEKISNDNKISNTKTMDEIERIKDKIHEVDLKASRK